MLRHAENLEFFDKEIFSLPHRMAGKKYSLFGLKIKGSFKRQTNSKTIAIWLHMDVVLVQLYSTLLFKIY